MSPGLQYGHERKPYGGSLSKCTKLPSHYNALPQRWPQVNKNRAPCSPIARVLVATMMLKSEGNGQPPKNGCFIWNAENRGNAPGNPTCQCVRIPYGNETVLSFVQRNIATEESPDDSYHHVQQASRVHGKDARDFQSSSSSTPWNPNRLNSRPHPQARARIDGSIRNEIKRNQVRLGRKRRGRFSLMKAKAVALPPILALPEGMKTLWSTVSVTQGLGVVLIEKKDSYGFSEQKLKVNEKN
ncbi:hypothetical protein Tco_0519971 [Tanacetum coccineum]